MRDKERPPARVPAVNQSKKSIPAAEPRASDSSVSGYAAVFEAYRSAGWLGVLPLPAGKKKLPPTGFTGRDGIWPSYADCYSWAEDMPDGNVALRLPENVIGIDVDHYDGKPGGNTLAKLETQHGLLPATWRTGSRSDGVSGIRLYRVPAGLQWPGDLGAGIEIIQTRHRYAIVWPSRHPNGGTYRWTKPDGSMAADDETPRPANLPELPNAWIDGLTRGRAAKDIATADLDSGQASAWLEEHGSGEACHVMGRALDGYLQQLEAGDGRSRHDTTKDGTMNLAHLAAEGHAGGSQALAQLRRAFSTAADDRTPEELAGEWQRLLLGAVRIAAMDTIEPQDPCDNPFYGILEPADHARLTAAPKASTQPVAASHTAPPTATPADVDADAVRRSFPVLDWAARWDAPVEEEWIVFPILPARRLVSLYSPPKTGKSLLMLELAAAVAAGREVLGVVPTPRRVLYVDFENDPDADVIPRLKDMGYAPADIQRLDYLSFPTMGTLDSERGALDLMAALDVYGSEVVVVDTVSRSVGGVENENDTWLNFYRHTGLRLKQRGVALIRLDHTGKDETKGQRGGSAKSGDVDAVWRLSTVVQDETYRLECEMARMQVAEKTVILNRLTKPTLRHKVDGSGGRGAFKAGLKALIDAMDADGLPDSAGRTAARKCKEDHNLKASTKLLEEAVKVRQARPGAAVQMLLDES